MCSNNVREQINPVGNIPSLNFHCSYVTENTLMPLFTFAILVMSFKDLYTSNVYFGFGLSYCCVTSPGHFFVEYIPVGRKATSSTCK